jgi:hypothetical protein
MGHLREAMLAEGYRLVGNSRTSGKLCREFHNVLFDKIKLNVRGRMPAV